MIEIKDFEELKKKIEDSKTKKNRTEGSLQEAMSRLTKEFNCSTMEEAEAKISDLQKEIDNDEIKLAELLKNIESSVDWEKL